jgi:hypothetical protein
LVTEDRTKRPKFMKSFKARRQLSYSAKDKKHEQENIKAVHSLWDEETKAPVEHLDKDDSSDESASSNNDPN